MANQVFVQVTQPAVVKAGDFWINPQARTVKVVTSTDPKTEFADVFTTVVAALPIADVAGSVPAGGVGAAAGGWDTAGNRDTAIATITEIKTQLNVVLARLRSLGLIQN